MNNKDKYNFLNLKTKKEKVLHFINYEFKKYEKDNIIENTFTKGLCYYFAIILKDRFDGSIYFIPEEGHFITKIDRDYYDITGCVTEKYKDKELYPKEKWMYDSDIIYGYIMKYID